MNRQKEEVNSLLFLTKELSFQVLLVKFKLF